MPFYTGLYALIIFLKFRYGKWKKAPHLRAVHHDGSDILYASDAAPEPVLAADEDDDPSRITKWEVQK